MWDLSETSTLTCSLGLSLPEQRGGCAAWAVGRGCLTRRPGTYPTPVPWLGLGPVGLSGPWRASCYVPSGQVREQAASAPLSLGSQRLWQGAQATGGSLVLGAPTPPSPQPCAEPPGKERPARRASVTVRDPQPGQLHGSFQIPGPQTLEAHRCL